MAFPGVPPAGIVKADVSACLPLPRVPTPAALAFAVAGAVWEAGGVRFLLPIIAEGAGGVDAGREEVSDAGVSAEVADIRQRLTT